MSNPRSIIKGAFRSLGRLGRGRDLTGDESTDGLELLNQLIASWKGEGLLLPYRTTEQLTYSTSKISYTIGSGGDFNTVRPVQTVDAFHRDGTGVDYSMDQMNLREFNNIAYKNVGKYPERYYYEPEYPLGKIHFDYLPDTGLTLHLISMNEVTAFADLTTTINLPSEYDKALRSNLAVDWAPDFGQAVSSELMLGAVESKNALKRIAKANREDTLVIDSGLRTRGRYNINSDRYNR